jgi:hypothetical protein
MLVLFPVTFAYLVYLGFTHSVTFSDDCQYLKHAFPIIDGEVIYQDMLLTVSSTCPVSATGGFQAKLVLLTIFVVGVKRVYGSSFEFRGYFKFRVWVCSGEGWRIRLGDLSRFSKMSTVFRAEAQIIMSASIEGAFVTHLI